MQNKNLRQFYVISAERASFTPSANLELTQALHQDIHKLGFDKIHCKGQYKAKWEASFVVFCSETEAILLAGKYDQESILHVDGSRNASLIYLDKLGECEAGIFSTSSARENIGQWQQVDYDEAITLDGFTLDLESLKYYACK